MPLAQLSTLRRSLGAPVQPRILRGVESLRPSVGPRVGRRLPDSLRDELTPLVSVPRLKPRAVGIPGLEETPVAEARDR